VIVKFNWGVISLRAFVFGSLPQYSEPTFNAVPKTMGYMHPLEPKAFECITIPRSLINIY
jgi:hypothetical protein